MVGLALLSITFSIGMRLSYVMILNFVKLATMSSVMVTVIYHRCAHLVLRVVIGGSPVGLLTCHLVFGLVSCTKSTSLEMRLLPWSLLV